MKDHIHTPDGRGLRRVLLNGEKELRGVVFADTARGIADVIREPVTICRRDGRVITSRLRGRVEVLPYE